MECPICKEKVTVGSGCPVCGHEFENNSEGQSSRDLSESMERLLNNIKALPEVSLGKVFAGCMTWVMPLMAIGFLVMALKSEAGLFWILFAVAAAASAFRFAFLMRKSESDAQKEYSTMCNDMDSMIRTAKREYRHSPEMMKVVQDFEEQMFKVSKGRDAALRRNRLVAFVISVLLVIILVLSIVGVNSLVG